jgi:hypothetical protein
MKFVLNKQTGVFVLKEDMFDRISRQAKAEVGAEIRSEKEQAKRFKNYEEIRIESEKEYKKAKQTNDQNKKEYEEAKQRLTNLKETLLQYKEGKKKPQFYKNFNGSKEVALYLEDPSKNPKPNQQQIDSYINVLKNKAKITDVKQLDQIKKDIITFVNYSEEPEQIDQKMLADARENVKSALMGAKIIGVILSENPEVIPIINKLAEYLCLQKPVDNIADEFKREITDLLSEIPKLLTKKGIVNRLIGMTPIGTVNLVKSLYIVAKYRQQCSNKEEESNNLEVIEDQDNQGDLNNKKDELSSLYSDSFIPLLNEILKKENNFLTDEEAIKYRDHYESHIEYYKDVYNDDDLEKINEAITRIKGSIEFLTNEISKRSRSTISESKILKEYREEINNLLIPHMQKQLGFNHPPTINFAEDSENAQDMFGKTAYYNPSTSEITVYVTNRHPKDIMRSVAHEVIHHAQNQRGEFENSFNLGEEGYAQNNSHLRSMEEEAYLSGNMIFRDWEDNFKKQRNQNKMINESSLRAKIRSMIKEEMYNHTENEPAKEHDADCGCDECSNKKRFLEDHGVKNIAESVEKEIMPLKEWRNMELNSLLLNKFGIVSPQVLGEKTMTPKEKELAAKYPPEDKITRGDVITAAKEKGGKSAKKPEKKGKVPPQFLKKGKKDESK